MDHVLLCLMKHYLMDCCPHVLTLDTVYVRHLKRQMLYYFLKADEGSSVFVLSGQSLGGGLPCEK